MAIDNTIDWLITQIPDKKRMEHFRKKFGETRVHQVTYVKPWIQGYVREELMKIIIKAQRQGLIGDANYGKNKEARLKEYKEARAIIEKEAFKAYAGVYNPTNIRKKWKAAFGGKFTGRIYHSKTVGYTVEYVGNSGKFKWAAKHSIKRGKRATPEIARKLIDEYARDVWRNTRANSRYKKLGLKLGNIANPVVATLTEGKRDTGNRLHGIPSGSLNPEVQTQLTTDKRSSTGKSASTVALLGFEEDVSANLEDWIFSHMEKSYVETYKQIQDYLDTEYRVENIKFSDIKHFRDKITMSILMGQQRQNSLMKYADANGIREYLETVRTLLIQSLGNPAVMADWAERKGSKKTPRERMNESIVGATVEPIVKTLKKNKNIRVTTTVKKSKPVRQTAKKKRQGAKSKAGGKRQVSKTGKITKANLQQAAAATATKRGGGSSRGLGGGETSINPIGLQQLLNKSLPKEVADNMGPYPRRLEYRTGRFADSAQVTQVVPMPRSVEIRYTYQKDPYSVFEPEFGNPLASRGRDPKQIIGGTIRELAQEIMGTKYGLVRTKRV